MLIIIVTLILFIGASSAGSNELDSKLESDVLKESVSPRVRTNGLKGTPFNISLLLTKQLDNMVLPNGANIETWVAPHGIPKKFVYYLAGYDEEKRPIWIVEGGNWFIKGAIQEGHLIDLDLYLRQLAYRAIKSMVARSTPEDPVNEVIFLVDFDNLSFEQIRHLPTVTYILGMARDFQPLIDKYMGESVIVNGNYATDVIVNLLRPIFGSIFERVTIFGNSKRKWLPFLRRKFLTENLPEWYGGSKDFKPLKVYGR